MENKNKFILEAIGITKHFGGVYALDNVTMNLKYGEVLGIVGDNGAGKSTLIKIISGALKPDSGDFYFDGKKAIINSPVDAYRLGIETVYQDLGLVDIQGPAFNIFLGRELTYTGFLKKIGYLNDKKMLKETSNLISRLNVNLGSLDREMGSYSGGQRQSVAIGRSIYWGNKIIILDEPTAALGVKESKEVLDLINRLKEQTGISIVIISHNMQHIFNVVDRVMILRRGKLVTIQDIDNVTLDDVVKYITGSEKVDRKDNKTK